MGFGTVRTRRTTTVSLPTTGGEAPLPAPGPRVPLSPFDTRWVTLPPHYHVFLYPASSPAITFPDIVRSLKSSLAEVLPAFHPLAGELTYSPESRTMAIVCGADAHVAFVEAETDLEFKRLAEDAVHDVAAFQQLVPDILRETLPAPVLAVQVTEFVGGSGGGGVAVGVAMNHVALDGRGFFQFMETWAAVAKGTVSARKQDPPALHDRSLLAFEYDDDQVGVYLQHVAPDLPKMVQDDHPPPLGCRTFTFTASALRQLKQQLATAAAGTKPSTFAALAAHGWVSIAKCRGLTDGAPVFAAFPADCRALLSPPVPDGYTGNCVTTCLVVLSGEELTGPDGFTRAFLSIMKAIEEVKGDPLAHWRKWFVKVEDITRGHPMVILTGSPRLPIFGVDFGFGRPTRSELASIHQDNQVVMFEGRDVGSVQVSVAITADWMPALSEIFIVDA